MDRVSLCTICGHRQGRDDSVKIQRGGEGNEKAPSSYGVSSSKCPHTLVNESHSADRKCSARDAIKSISSTGSSEDLQGVDAALTGTANGDRSSCIETQMGTLRPSQHVHTAGSLGLNLDLTQIDDLVPEAVKQTNGEADSDSIMSQVAAGGKIVRSNNSSSCVLSQLEKMRPHTTVDRQSIAFSSSSSASSSHSHAKHIYLSVDPLPSASRGRGTSGGSRQATYVYSRLPRGACDRLDPSSTAKRRRMGEDLSVSLGRCSYSVASGADDDSDSVLTDVTPLDWLITAVCEHFVEES